MTRSEALSTVLEAAQIRSDMWSKAAKDELGFSELDCFFEADSEECEFLADNLWKAINVLRKEID